MALSSTAVACITVSAVAHLLPPLITQAVADVQKSTCRRVISPLKPHLVPRSTDRALCCCKRSCFWESVRAGCMVSAYSLRHSLSTSLTYLSDGGGVGNHFGHQDLWYQPNPTAGRTQHPSLQTTRDHRAFTKGTQLSHHHLRLPPGHHHATTQSAQRNSDSRAGSHPTLALNLMAAGLAITLITTPYGINQTPPPDGLHPRGPL
jgi:hypothetical protein